MSIAAGFWTWLLVLVFGGGLSTAPTDAPPPPGEVSSEGDVGSRSLPTPPTPVRRSSDRIYVGF